LLRIDVNNRSLIAAGGIGGVAAAICCTTPILAIVFGALGLTAWLSKADFVLIPALLICLGLVALGLYRRGVAAPACRDPNSAQSSRSKP
jgi:mercuric ion transport protein